MKEKPTVIAVVNPNIPRTFGDSFVHVSDIDMFCEDNKSALLTYQNSHWGSRMWLCLYFEVGNQSDKPDALRRLFSVFCSVAGRIGNVAFDKTAGLKCLMQFLEFVI